MKKIDVNNQGNPVQKQALKKKREKEKSLSRWESEGGMAPNEDQKKAMPQVKST
jgi:hypothetical protein